MLARDGRSVVPDLFQRRVAGEGLYLMGRASAPGEPSRANGGPTAPSARPRPCARDRSHEPAPHGLSKRDAIGHRASNGDVAERLKALVC